MISVIFALVIVGILLVVVVAGQPDEFIVSRSAKFAVLPGMIFPRVNDLHKWEEWSPWAKLDPNAKNSFDGPESGVGAAMAWEGNCKVGVGRMTITQSLPNEMIGFRLEFLKPMEATNSAEFTFRPEGNYTVVTWTMSGKNSSVGKAIGLFMNCDKMVGGQFERGLASLKSLTENAARS